MFYCTDRLKSDALLHFFSWRFASGFFCSYVLRFSQTKGEVMYFSQRNPQNKTKKRTPNPTVFSRVVHLLWLIFWAAFCPAARVNLDCCVPETSISWPCLCGKEGNIFVSFFHWNACVCPGLTGKQEEWPNSCVTCKQLITYFCDFSREMT